MGIHHDSTVDCHPRSISTTSRFHHGGCTSFTSSGAIGNPRRLRLHPDKPHPPLPLRPSCLSPAQTSRPANPPTRSAANRLPHLHPALALPLQWLEQHACL